MKRHAPPPYEPTPEDYIAYAEMQQAVVQAAPFPEEDRWSLFFETLPEDRLCYILKSRQMEQAVLLGRMMPIVMFIANVYGEGRFSAEERPRVLFMLLEQMILASAAEMERRRLRFCVSVAPQPNPFVVFFEPESLYKPKDPETFHLEELIQYYTDFCGETP